MVFRLASTCLVLLLLGGRVAAGLGDIRRWRWLTPLASALTVLVAIASPQPQTIAYQFAMAAGLTVAAIADMLLMLPDDRNLPWILANLLAMVIYLVGFTGDVRGVMPLMLGIPLLLLGLLLYARMAARFGDNRLWQLAQAIVVSFVVWTALGRAIRLPEPQTYASAAGASVLFVAFWIRSANRLGQAPRAMWMAAVIGNTLAQLLLAWSV